MGETIVMHYLLKILLSSVLVLQLGCGVSFSEEWTMEAEARAVVPIAEGIEIQVWSAELTAEVMVEMHLVFLDTEFSELVVIDNGEDRNDLRFSDLPEALAAYDCVVGTNGAFFELSSFEPSGWVVSEGEEVAGLKPESWMRGLLVQTEEGIRLSNLDELVTEPTSALQSGPWLLVKGEAETEFTNDERRRPRTFFALAEDSSQGCLGTVQNCTLRELALLFANPEFRKIFPAFSALNLDGGASTAMAYDSLSFSHNGYAVRNFLGVRPR